MRSERADLTRASVRAYFPVVVGKQPATGGESPIGAARSRTAHVLRLFSCLGVSAFYGGTGRGSRKARRCSAGLSTPLGCRHPGVRAREAVRFTNRSEHITMANTAKGAHAPTQPHLPAIADELVIELDADIGFCRFVGTRAQLEAEGLIPHAMLWPQGFEFHHWQAGPNDFMLRRHRPAGAKGPRKAFLDVDHWMLCVDLINREHWADRQIRLKAKDLASTIHRASARGQAEWMEQCHALHAARRDPAFCAFKALIPGVDRPARGRRAKRSGELQERSA